MSARSAAALLLLAAAAAAAAAAAQAQAGAPANTVVVDIPRQGAIRGWSNATHRAFFGIPYAQPPVGDLRWVAPQTDPAPFWQGERSGLAPRPGCPQDCILPPHTCPQATNESCLFLDVYTPVVDDSKQQLRPVMVFIPGGRFEQGAGSSALYSGQHLCNESGVVLVTINYRLGALGFLATDVMRGNFGIQDQRAALRWVQANIKVFGGDPSQVTLFGQSAGAASTSVHLVSPLSKGLFHRAIVESNPWALPMKPLDTAREIGKRFVKDLDCTESGTAAEELACLRKADVAAILAAQKKAQQHIPITHALDLFMPWVPTIDGVEMTDEPRLLLRDGKWNEVPLMTGTVQNEAYLFIYQADKKELTKAEYAAVIAFIFKTHALRVLREYPDRPLNETKHGEDMRPRLAQLGTDYIFNCAERNMLSGLVNNTANRPPVYRYSFQHHFKADAWGPEYPECEEAGIVCHGSELVFVFGDVKPFFSFTPDEAILAKFMQTAWTNFAISANPNQPNAFPTGQPQFAQYRGPEDHLMEFRAPTSVAGKGYLEDQCAMFDSLGKKPYQWGFGNE